MEDSFVEKIVEKINPDSSSSSSDSDDDAVLSSFKPKIKRLFGRETDLHGSLGGGKAADVLLWRDEKTSGIVLGVATAIWMLFDVLEYHFLTLVSHALITGLVILFLWTNGSTFIKKSPPHIPDVVIPEKPVLEFVSDLRIAINRALSFLREIASGRDLKKFFTVIAVLWLVSIVGGYFNILTLFYIIMITVLTMPLVYEKYEDEIDSFTHKAEAELKKQYAVFEAKVLSKTPRRDIKRE